MSVEDLQGFGLLEQRSTSFPLELAKQVHGHHSRQEREYRHPPCDTLLTFLRCGSRNFCCFLRKLQVSLHLSAVRLFRLWHLCRPCNSPLGLYLDTVTGYLQCFNLFALRIVGSERSGRYIEVMVGDKGELLHIRTLEFITYHLRGHLRIVTVDRHPVDIVVWHLIVFQTAVPFDGHGQVDRFVLLGRRLIDFTLDVKTADQIRILRGRLDINLQCVGDKRLPGRAKEPSEDITSACIHHRYLRCGCFYSVVPLFLRYEDIA